MLTFSQENDSGELELDIDMLSNDCLVKLWQLCKKVLPNFGKDKSAATSSPAAPKPPKSSKPKKNKPMSAREQEQRIAELKTIRDTWKAGQEPPAPTLPEPHPADESSEDSDSEEE